MPARSVSRRRSSFRRTGPRRPRPRRWRGWTAATATTRWGTWRRRTSSSARPSPSPRYLQLTVCGPVLATSVEALRGAGGHEGLAPRLLRGGELHGLERRHGARCPRPPRPLGRHRRRLPRGPVRRLAASVHRLVQPSLTLRCFCWQWVPARRAFDVGEVHELGIGHAGPFHLGGPMASGHARRRLDRAG